MGELQIYSQKEIEESVKNASAFEVVHELARRNDGYSLLATGVFLGEKVVDAVLEQNVQRNDKKQLDEPSFEM